MTLIQKWSLSRRGRLAVPLNSEEAKFGNNILRMQKINLINFKPTINARNNIVSPGKI